MKQDVFEELLNRRLNLIRQTLAAKAEEYAAGGDRLHNFKVAASLIDRTPADALQGMLAKHWVSIKDLVFDYAMRPEWLKKNQARIDEKLGDGINYLILLEAILKE